MSEFLQRQVACFASFCRENMILLDRLHTHAVNEISYTPVVYMSTRLYKCVGIFHFWYRDL